MGAWAAAGSILLGVTLALLLLLVEGPATGFLLSRRTLLAVQLPEAGSEFPQGGVAVLIEFPEEARVAPETFRCLLNGRDVTDLLTVGRNGVAGSIFPVREGANELELEVFGRARWGDWLVEDHLAIPFRALPLIYMDRA